MKLTLFSIFLFLVALSSARRSRGRSSSSSEQKALNLTKEAGHERDSKFFSLFNIVQFSNQGCRSTSSISGGTGSSTRNGTCFTSTECSSKGGSAAGSCAAGFGVCCVFLVSTSGGAVNQNCTYVRNPGFPATYGQTAAVTYTINKCSSSVCYLRLDFESFTLAGTGNTEETDQNGNDGGVCQDMFTATVNTNQRVPVICGQNTGQHIYLDMGRGNTDTAQFQFSFGAAAATNRIWEIKVTQLECNCYAPPNGCLQYHTGLTGRFTTFNFATTTDNHLANQDYSVCIRQEAGFCCIEYCACSDANSFTLSTVAAIAAGRDTDCSLDYIAIEGGSSSCACDGMTTQVNKYCGQRLNANSMLTVSEPICDCTAPFAVDVFTDALPDSGIANTPNAATMISRGVCLTWRQIPC